MESNLAEDRSRRYSCTETQSSPYQQQVSKWLTQRLDDYFDDNACETVSALAVEILSPCTMSEIFTSKMDLYREAGVREYWIVDPFAQKVHIYLLQARSEKRRTLQKDETLASPTFPGLEIPLSEIFPATNSGQ